MKMTFLRISILKNIWKRLLLKLPRPPKLLQDILPAVSKIFCSAVVCVTCAFVHNYRKIYIYWGYKLGYKLGIYISIYKPGMPGLPT